MQLSTVKIRQQVALALDEDLGTLGDVTASLVDTAHSARAYIIGREEFILCGQPWVEEIMALGAPNCRCEWLYQEGAKVPKNQHFVEFSGNSAELLQVERTVLNYLQFMSAVATKTHEFCQAVGKHPAKIVDTRKTIPGMREAQKYAVRIGGGVNHRMGLYDAALIKENHILALGSIGNAIQLARTLPKSVSFVEIEVETLEELEEALIAGAKMVLLDNMDSPTLARAVTINDGRAELEVSGGVTLAMIPTLAATGVDRISIGALTKDIKAIDLSLRFYKD